MNAKERRKAMYNLIKEKKFITINEIKNLFPVSEVTIRKDLDMLTAVGTIHRVFGGVTYSEIETGATYKNEILTLNETSKTSSIRSPQKNTHIVKLACNFIGDDDVIFLDSSDTSEMIAKHLLNIHKSPIIFTNSMEIFEILKNSFNMKIILVGGEYEQKTNCFIGELTQFFFERVRISKVFFSAKGFDINYGAETNPSSNLYIKRTVAANAETVIITATNDRFKRRGTIHLLPWQKIKCIITDSVPSDEFVHAIRSHNINLLYETDYFEGVNEIDPS